MNGSQNELSSQKCRGNCEEEPGCIEPDGFLNIYFTANHTEILDRSVSSLNILSPLVCAVIPFPATVGERFVISLVWLQADLEELEDFSLILVWFGDYFTGNLCGGHDLSPYALQPLDDALEGPLPFLTFLV